MLNWNIKHLFSLALVALLVTSCSKTEFPTCRTYVHLSHTRTEENPSMDAVVESKDYSIYDALLLGGDLASSTSQDDATMDHIDSFFDFESESTLWTLGNHDVHTPSRISQYTGRERYYAWHDHGVTFIVLDTQLDNSSITGDQLQFFESVVDTIQISHALILMTHKLIWMYENEDLESQINDVSNGILGECDYCLNPNNFYEDLYIPLSEVHERGVKVTCIAGDIGKKVSQFQYRDDNGIQFLASGIKHGEIGNLYLKLCNWPTLRSLLWSFEAVETL